MPVKKENSQRLRIYRKLNSIENFYHINRSGMDRSTHAGMLAAKAILTGNREEFILRKEQTLSQPLMNKTS